jgi:glycine betaine/proline transport system substrate-binding protein
MKKWTTFFVLLLAMLLILGSVAYAETMRVKIATLGWTPPSVQTEIMKTMLEKAGFRVEVSEFFEWGLAFTALSRGDADVMVSEIDFCAEDYWVRFKDRLEKISAISHGMEMGLVVPSYVTIDSIDELNANRNKFDGKIIGIEPGSGLMRQTRQVVEEYGLRYNLIEGSTAAMLASTKAAIDKGEWIVATNWVPSSSVVEWNLKFLKDPKNVQQPPQSIFIVARQGFSEEHPIAREVLASIFVPISEMNAFMTMVEKNGMTIPDAVDRWMTNNSHIVERWTRIGHK